MPPTAAGSVWASATPAAQRPAGRVITYTLTLTNQGQARDQFLLDLAGGTWPASLSPDDTAVLEPGSSIRVQAVVTVPLESAEAASDLDTCTVTATSIWTDTVSDAIRLTTVRTGAPGVGLAPRQASSAALPGRPAVYRVTLTNQATTRDSFRLAVLAGRWPTALSLQRTSLLRPGDSLTLLVTVTVPLDAQPGDADTALLSAVSRRDPQVHDGTVLVTGVLVPESGQVPGPPPPLHPYAAVTDLSLIGLRRAGRHLPLVT